MKKKSPDLQIVIPYSAYCDLLEAAQSVPELHVTIERQKCALDVLRSQLIELMDAFGELRRTVSD